MEHFQSCDELGIHHLLLYHSYHFEYRFNSYHHLAIAARVIFEPLREQQGLVNDHCGTVHLSSPRHIDQNLFELVCEDSN